MDFSYPYSYPLYDSLHLQNFLPLLILVGFNKLKMQDQRIEKVITVAINIVKVLVIIYLGFVEVFKVGKLLREKLDLELDISRKWATQNYSILKKRLEEQKVAGV